MPRSQGRSRDNIAFFEGSGLAISGFESATALKTPTMTPHAASGFSGSTPMRRSCEKICILMHVGRRRQRAQQARE